MIKSFIFYLSHPMAFLQRIRYIGLNSLEIHAINSFKYDCKRFVKYAGVFHPNTKENLEARIIHTYHGVEKGLTMPNRRLNFGHDAINTLVDYINQYVVKYGEPKGQIEHAIRILKAYLEMHKDYDGKSDVLFWNKIHDLTDRYPKLTPATQPHFTEAEFYKYVNCDFEKFASSRHTSRHYSGIVSEDEIRKVVKLAMTAPSACNRQAVRVHCVSDKKMMDKVLELQSGNRGFGTDSDKLLIITGELSDICWVDERYDIYTNCGIFIMNLCYSLFYYKIAHCVLNWSICVSPQKDKELHELVNIPQSEVVAAMITCGRTPEEFDVAESPRKNVDEVLSIH